MCKYVCLCVCVPMHVKNDESSTMEPKHIHGLSTFMYLCSSIS